MQEFHLRVQGSSTEPYEVRFVSLDGELYASCSCAAGDAGQSCKHRLLILDGKLGGVVDGENSVPVISQLLAGTALDVAMQELGAAEAALERAKKAVSDAKKKLARSFQIPR